MRKHIFKLIALKTFMLCLLGVNSSFGQGVNGITILPITPNSSDTIVVISDFSYYGNCIEGLVNVQVDQMDSLITIIPSFCGYGDTTLCNSVDTFTIGVLPDGYYLINVQYHQGSICPVSSFDTIIANIDTTLEIGTLSTGSITSIDHGINIYPNPTTDYIKIQSKNSIKAIELFDITGKEMRFLINDESLDLQSLNPGFYILNIHLKNGQVVTKKIIKNNAR